MLASAGAAFDDEGQGDASSASSADTDSSAPSADGSSPSVSLSSSNAGLAPKSIYGSVPGASASGVWDTSKLDQMQKFDEDPDAAILGVLQDSGYKVPKQKA